MRATNSQEREIEQFHELNDAQAAAEERSAEALSLLFPITETLAVIGAMVIVTCAYIFLVRPGHMLSSYLLAYGFILLRLLPLLNQLYELHGHLAYLAGGIHEVKTWLDTPHFPERPFGTVSFGGLRGAALRARRLPVSERHARARGHRLRRARGTDRRDRRAVGRRQVDAREHPAAPARADVGTHHGRRPRLLGLHPPESWHRATALVEQDAFLFHGTLRENILYGCDDVDRGGAPSAIAAAHLTDVVTTLPDGLDTLVGERGAMVSGGQRQRIAIARALIRNPSILILDEATSHLDSVSERLVQQALQNASRGRTTIVIAHRLSTIREADLLIVLENGRIARAGDLGHARHRRRRLRASDSRVGLNRRLAPRSAFAWAQRIPPWIDPALERAEPQFRYRQLFEQAETTGMEVPAPGRIWDSRGRSCNCVH